MTAGGQGFNDQLKCIMSTTHTHTPKVNTHKLQCRWDTLGAFSVDRWTKRRPKDLKWQTEMKGEAHTWDKPVWSVLLFLSFWISEEGRTNVSLRLLCALQTSRIRNKLKHMEFSLKSWTKKKRKCLLGSSSWTVCLKEQFTHFAHEAQFSCLFTWRDSL